VSAYFLTGLKVKLYGRGTWITEAPLVFYSEVARRLFEVPAKFVTDFASVPRTPLAFAIAGGRAPQAATPHDYLYQHPDWEDRALADAIFRELMGIHQPAFGIEPEPEAIRQSMWAGVRTFGWIPWGRYEKRSKALNPIWTASAWPEVQAA